MTIILLIQKDIFWENFFVMYARHTVSSKWNAAP